MTGGSDLTMKETNDIVELLTYELDQDANVIWGARINEGYNGTAKVSAIMTGVEPKWTFGGDYAKRENVINQNERPVHKGVISDIIPVIR